jgi:Lrp/AsnC family leucine-responsive transcriptional regulator
MAAGGAPAGVSGGAAHRRSNQTGDDCFVARVALRSMEQLDEIVDRIAEKAATSTAIVKSQPIPRRLPPLG